MTRRFLIALALLLVPAEVWAVCGGGGSTCYVDTDTPVACGSADGDAWATAYCTLNDFETAEGANLTGNGVMTVNLRASSGTADTEAVSISGWTTTASDYIDIINADDHGGAWNDTKYRLNVTNAVVLDVREENTRIDGIQLSLVCTDTGNDQVFRTYGIVAGGDQRLSNSILTIDASDAGCSAGDYKLIYIYDGQSEFTGWNNILHDDAAANITDAFKCENGAIVDLYFHTVSTDYNCFNINGGATVGIDGTIANGCASGRHFVGTADTGDYNATDADDADTPDSGGNSVNTFTATDVFTDPASHDYSMKVGSALIDEGGSGWSYGDPDVIGTSRGASWDIGAFEYDSGGPPAARRIFLVH